MDLEVVRLLEDLQREISSRLSAIEDSIKHLSDSKWDVKLNELHSSLSKLNSSLDDIKKKIG